MAYRLVKRRIC